MKIFGYKLSSWICHPILGWEAFQRQKCPIVNLDNPEKNCEGCGHDHSLASKRVSCLCCKYGHCRSHRCCFCYQYVGDVCKKNTLGL